MLRNKVIGGATLRTAVEMFANISRKNVLAADDSPGTPMRRRDGLTENNGKQSVAAGSRGAARARLD